MFPLANEHGNRDFHHMHRQLKAVCTLIQPEYRPFFNRMIKLLELNFLLDDLAPERSQPFHASSVEEPSDYTPCDLTTFVKAVAPECSRSELDFLNQLQSTSQRIQLFDQLLRMGPTFQENSVNSLLQQMMDPSQQKMFQEYQAAFSSQSSESRN